MTTAVICQLSLPVTYLVKYESLIVFYVSISKLLFLLIIKIIIK